MTGADDAAGRLLAHRGASATAPENTLAAFRAAAAAGARWVEFDVSLIGDGTPVLHHDATLDRCTDRTGALARLTAADLPGIDAGGWFGPAFAGEPLATLSEALGTLAAEGLRANLEMKPHGADPGPLAAAVAEALDPARPGCAEILVSSFDHAALAALAERRPRQPRALLWSDPPADWPDRVVRAGAVAMHMDHRHLTRRHLAEAEAAGIALRVYTVNDPDRLSALRVPGLAGVITDDPARFLADPGWADWTGLSPLS